MPAGCEWIRPQWVAVENKREEEEKIKKEKLRRKKSKSISKSLPKFTWQILCFANF
jgi:hypothetical protein